MVLDTWTKLHNTDSELKEENFEDDLNELFLNENKNLLYSSNNYLQSDSDTSNDNHNILDKLKNISIN